jgi:FkbM family methyltransferase
MGIAEYIYRLVVRLGYRKRAPILRRQLLRLRRLILLFADPVVHVPISEDGRELSMRLSHALPLLKSSNPLYDSIFDRLARNARKFEPRLTMIDVGANIGDTVSSVENDRNSRFLCVEGDERHFALLERNTRSLGNVTCVHTILSDRPGSGGYGLHTLHGTSYVVSDVSGAVSIHTLDTVVAQYPDFEQANVLKIDTDGFDLKVLRGANGLLARAKPAVVFELAPRHYVKAGNEDPKQAFDFLRSADYDLTAVYNSAGVLMIAADVSDDALLDAVRQLIDCAHYEGRYFDIVAFHRTHRARYDAFLQGERELFMPPDPAQYELT